MGDTFFLEIDMDKPVRRFPRLRMLLFVALVTSVVLFGGFTLVALAGMLFASMGALHSIELLVSGLMLGLAFIACAIAILLVSSADWISFILPFVLPWLFWLAAGAGRS